MLFAKETKNTFVHNARCFICRKSFSSCLLSDLFSPFPSPLSTTGRLTLANYKSKARCQKAGFRQLEAMGDIGRRGGKEKSERFSPHPIYFRQSLRQWLQLPSQCFKPRSELPPGSLPLQYLPVLNDYPRMAACQGPGSHWALTPGLWLTLPLIQWFPTLSNPGIASPSPGCCVAPSTTL